MSGNAGGGATTSRSAKDRARVALIERLRDVLPPERGALIDETGRTELFEDNLVPSLSRDKIEVVRHQLKAGDGRELDPGRHGQRPDGHAAHSSACLACNALGAWVGHEDQLVIDGVGGFNEGLRVEAKQRIFRGGRAPNLDCLAVGADVVVGVESKLTEPLARHRRAEWSEAYGRDSCRGLLSGGWLETLDAARRGEYSPTYLDVDQLLKHALGLSKQHPGRERHLVYVFWEPLDGGEFSEVRDHRAEVQEVLGRVGEATPHLHALTWARLWEQWDVLPAVPWLGDHVSHLRQRYELAIGTRA